MHRKCNLADLCQEFITKEAITELDRDLHLGWGMNLLV